MNINFKNKTIPVQRVFCIGRNYVAHVEELRNELPESPVVFFKPSQCLVAVGEKIAYPPHGRELHYEGELVVLVGKSGRALSQTEARDFVGGLSLGLDLTLRDVQDQLKAKGLPWEKAKCFEQSAPIGDFIPFHEAMDLTNISFTCRVNGELRQEGHSSKMIFPIERLIVELSKIWMLREGDLIYSGTPAGVGPLKKGDEITLHSDLIGSFSWEII
ncbi:MAG: fumarylacetoacetate hydrolase family protein [Calditrichia bacterium]